MTQPNVHQLVRALADQISNAPDAATLRAIRDRIDSRAFKGEIQEYRRGLNDPDALNVFEDDLTAFRRLVEDRRARLDYDRQQIGIIGLGGGVALVGGGLIAAVSIAIPPLAIFPCLGGILMTASSYKRGSQLSDEISLCDQIVTRMKEMDDD